MPIDVLESSNFNKYFKKVLKKYKRSFEEDYAIALKVITKRPDFYNKDYKAIPKTKEISRLGENIKLPVLKTEIYIEQAKGYSGRLVYIFDAKSEKIFMLDAYCKVNKENYDASIINIGYNEYVSSHRPDLLPKIIPKLSPLGRE